jgi:hypothetical protein
MTLPTSWPEGYAEGSRTWNTTEGEHDHREREVQIDDLAHSYGVIGPIYEEAPEF